MPARKPKPDEKLQRERFIETAREIGASEKPEDFERAFGSVVGREGGGKSRSKPKTAKPACKPSR